MLTSWRHARKWLRAGAAVPQQQAVRDFAKSRAKAAKDIKNRVPVRQRAGMPRFKKREVAEPTLNYTRSAFRIKDGRLHLAGGIVVTVVWSRGLPSVPSSVRIYRDSLGDWYASFVVVAPTEPMPTTGAAIGIDWGVRKTATTTSDAHDLPNLEYGEQAQARLTRYDRMMARRRTGAGKPTSKGYHKAKRLRARAYKKVARQRQDTARKWAKHVVTDFDVIAVEDFRPKFLARSRMARKAADAAIGTAKTALLDMGRKHGWEVHLVNPAYTTMDCAQCGARAKHALSLSERRYSCTVCGAQSDRDKNSARVMLLRAGLSPDGVDRIRPDGSQGHQAA